MLQINTGKLYPDGVGRSQTIRGIFYSNICLRGLPELHTAAGVVIAADQLRGTNTLILQMEERLADGRERPGVLISHGADPYVMDFALVMSFYFNAIAHPDGELVRQLLTEVPSLSSHKPPRDYISKCFDPHIYPTSDELAGFASFVEDLLGLERRHYLAAIRAIRTYVAATHRLRDQLDASYALMVSSVESLVHEFDHYESTWNDIPSEKRKAIDAALSEVADEQAAKVRIAIIKSEHMTVGRRYREFMKRHSQLQTLSGDSNSPVAGAPARFFEIDTALTRAYRLRSIYLHESKPLPTEIAHNYGYSDIVYCERWATLTFQGLARLTRCAIRGFVRESPKVEKEVYDYSLERAGVIRAKLHPSGWIHLPLERAEDGKDRFEGFLTVLAELFSSKEEPALPDLTNVMEGVERLIPQATSEMRVPLLALYHLYNYLLHVELRVPRFEEYLAKFRRPQSFVAPEWLAAYSLTGRTIELSLESHRIAVAEYFRRRSRPGGLQAPAVVEVAMCLALAERYRQAGDTVELGTALTQAIEAGPSMGFLRELAATLDIQKPIDWRNYLWPTWLGNDRQGEHPGADSTSLS
ncbi:TPA: hypothetical protein QDZ10_001922 [Stenotrophomonas maltophilia]|nr:hypothetical protein [Stenotrophomonas maltophilia]